MKKSSQDSSRLFLLAVSCLAWGCGGSAGPTAPTAGSGSLTLQLHSGKELVGISSSVSGMATVGTASRSVQNGEATFDNVQVGSPVQFTGNGFMNWSSSVVSPGTLSAYLWPNDSFLPESGIRAMAYSFPDGKLRRAVGDVYVTLGDFAGDETIRSSFTGAVALLNDALGGGDVRYLVSDSPPTGAVVIIAKLDPNLAALTGIVDVGASAACGFPGSYQLVGGSIYYVNRSMASRSEVVAHELTHCFGVGHNPKLGGIMTATTSLARDFSADEKTVLRMMLRRDPGSVP